MKERYFVASNSADGFRSYYAGAFDHARLSRIYVIKGGSGTGKSYFMRQVAERAESLGMSVRYIYCSSDPTSLDGIVIHDMATAFLDGTSPHVYEPKTIGAVESYIDLSAFLNTNMLSKSRRVIEEINDKKRAAFAHAYEYLGAYGVLTKNMEDMIAPAIRWEKLKSFAKRFADVAREESGLEEHLLTRSVGMSGVFHYDTYFELSGIYYEINDYFESAHFLMSEIYSAIRASGADLRVSDHPIIRGRLDALCVSASGLTFEIGNGTRGEGRVVNMKRFILPDRISSVRSDYRAADRVRSDILDLALGELQKVKKHHFVLEEIYGAAMDFEAKEEFSEEFCNKIFSND